MKIKFSLPANCQELSEDEEKLTKEAIAAILKAEQATIKLLNLFSSKNPYSEDEKTPLFFSDTLNDTITEPPLDIEDFSEIQPDNIELLPSLESTDTERLLNLDNLRERMITSAKRIRCDDICRRKTPEECKKCLEELRSGR